MKNRRFAKRWIKIAAYLLAVSMLCSQSMVGLATEDRSETEQKTETTSEKSETEKTDQDGADAEEIKEEDENAESGEEGSDGQTQEGEETSEIRYITDIAPLAEEDARLTYEEKPSQEELAEKFPALLTVTLDGATDTEEIEVTWECGTDYGAQWSGDGKESYTFAPKWDESAYALSEEAAETVAIPVVTVEITHKDTPRQIEDLEMAQEDLEEITEQKSILALVYLCDKYEVKDAPSAEGAVVDSVVCGQSVQIIGVELDDSGNVWYEVSLYDQDKNYTGYIEQRYLASSDEKFLGWTDEYVQKAKEQPRKKARTISLMSSISSYPDVNQFPPSYQNKLLALKQKYPNWIFVKMETGVDFNTAVSNELGNKSWISSSKPASWKNGAAAQSGWSYASEGILRYYMDPRNFLTESSIFQFEQLTYNESYHTESAVQAIVANSFMKGEIPNEGMTYAGAFTGIGRELKISPFHLASRVLQEQGTKGTSQLISGTYKGYEGYYNYFNVGASGRDTELIVKGLTEARNRGWNSRYASLKGGAEVIGKNYILRGQDTLYLQKFNVTTNNRYNHQYMQNIMAPASEAPSINKAYSNTGSLNNSFVFKIPVYGNMPASACSQPDSTDTITLNKASIDSLAVDKTEKLTPYVNGSKVDSVSALSFSSDNTGVATVDAQGVVKAVSPGTAKITCSKSGAKSASCTVTVVKAEPVVDTPVLSPVVYKTGLKLSDVSLPSGWNWSNGNTPLSAGTASYPAVYTPADTTKYLAVTRQIGIKVSQAIPSCSVPEKLSAKIGSRLGSIALPNGFSWESDGETILDQAGEKTFFLSYDPQDKNYLALNHIPVIVRVIDNSVETEDSDDDYMGDLPESGGGSSGSGTGSGGSGSGSGTGNGGSSSGSGAGSGSSSSGSGTESGGSGDGAAGQGGTSVDSTVSQGSTGSSSPSFNGGPSVEEPGGENDTTTGKGSTSVESTTSKSSTSTESTTGKGSSSAESTTSKNSTSVESTTSKGSTSAESTASKGSTSAESTTSKSSSSTESTISKSSTSVESTTGKNSTSTSTESTTGKNSTSVESTTGKNSTSAESTTGKNSTSVESTTGKNSTGAESTTGKESTGTESTTGKSSTSAENTVSAGGASVRGSNKTSDSIAAGTNHSELLADAELVSEQDHGQGSEEQPVYERPSVTMDMEDVSILTDEMLQMAKEQNVDLALRMNDRATWHVDAGSVRGSFVDIDMKVLFESGVIPGDLLAQLAGENKYLEFSLAHDGEFGFGAGLEILLSPEDSGRYANLFYYDSEIPALEFICASVIDENGYAVFDMEHASDYVVIISDYPMTDVVAEHTESAEPEQGFPWGRLALAVVIVAALAALTAGGYFLFKFKIHGDEGDEDEEEEEGADEEGEDDEDEDGADDEGEIDIPAGAEETEQTKTAAWAIETAAETAQPDEPQSAEDDWIEDDEWQEPERAEEKDPYADDHAENDWIEDDEWDSSNDWMDDEEWEKKENGRKTDR